MTTLEGKLKLTVNLSVRDENRVTDRVHLRDASGIVPLLISETITPDAEVPARQLRPGESPAPAVSIFDDEGRLLVGPNALALILEEDLLRAAASAYAAFVKYPGQGEALAKRMALELYNELGQPEPDAELEAAIRGKLEKRLARRKAYSLANVEAIRAVRLPDES